MSFSRGNFDKSWELEKSARNIGRDNWVIEQTYWDQNNVQQTMYWTKPYIGGSASDPSPYKNAGEIAGKPPDRSQAAMLTRANNLPIQAIINSIKAAFPDPPGRVVPYEDDTGIVGEFVSEFMAYYVGWYRDYSQVEFASEPQKQCNFAGHTHVGIKVAVSDAESSVELQLTELFKVLP